MSVESGPLEAAYEGSDLAHEAGMHVPPTSLPLLRASVSTDGLACGDRCVVGS